MYIMYNTIFYKMTVIGIVIKMDIRNIKQTATIIFRIITKNISQSMKYVLLNYLSRNQSNNFSTTKLKLFSNRV
jgi:hypothetical protein